jgi:signal transduction histidine kinase
MAHRQAVVVEDIMRDPRIPVSAYTPTFVRSLVVVPIRSAAPIGAIGCYWAVRRMATPGEVRSLQALADSTAVAMENVALYADLERRVAERTAELQCARAELAAQNEALVALAQRKDHLSALIVHDIRSPAMALMMRARQRAGAASADAERRAWSSIYANGEALARLATNLLDVARSDDGMFTLDREDVDVGALVAGVGREMQLLAEARDQRLTVRTESAVYVDADSEVLRRVLHNLAENAILHNVKGGTVAIEARTERDAVVLSVSDDGPGIPVDQRDRIFDKYVRLDDGGPRRGHGLGLAFCRLAVEEHGGRIWVEDAGQDGKSRGSRFVVRLPRAAPISSVTLRATTTDRSRARVC